ncbi:MAG: alpha-ketoacid dehydrogenase subunit beta [Chloroflexota bacterium]|nr:alpha-ketoacid dehydrogenase subunit beta [Chloroflexota bacterium]
MAEKTKKRKMRMVDAINQAMIDEMRRDETVFLMGEEVAGGSGGTYGASRDMLEEFGPRRVRNMPISEMVIGGCATGAAMNGLKPIAEYMTVNFAMLGIDAIVNHAAKIYSMFGGQFNVPATIRMAATWSQNSATHSQTIEGWFAHIPGLKVVYPGMPIDAYGMLRSAIQDPDPVIFYESINLYYNRQLAQEFPDDLDYISLSKNEVKREGEDVTILTYGRMLPVSLQAAEELEKEGISAEVVDMRVLRPLDLEPAITSFKKTYHAVVATDDWRTVGMSAELSASVYEHAFDYLDAPIKRVTAQEVPSPYNRQLELAVFPDKEDVKRAVMEVLE